MLYVDIPHGIRSRLNGIARTHPAVQYDKHDPNAAAIEACAAELGITAIAAEGLTPRTMYGAFLAPPAPPLPSPDAVTAVGAALHSLICAELPGAKPDRPCAEDAELGAALLMVLGADGTGWELTRRTHA